MLSLYINLYFWRKLCNKPLGVDMAVCLRTAVRNGVVTELNHMKRNLQDSMIMKFCRRQRRVNHRLCGYVYAE